MALILLKGGDTMIFLSSLLRQSVYDNENHRVGGIRDVCVVLNETFPVVTALIVHSSLNNNDKIIPWTQVHSIEEQPVHLTVNQAQITPYVPQADELLLRRDILDKQIVDTQGFRVVKVNDLKLVQIKKTARLLGVDISFSGLLRRLGVQPAVDMLSRVAPMQLAERTITWNYVEPMQVVRIGMTGQLAAVGASTTTATIGTPGVIPQVQLNVSHNKLADLRPADIADILEQLDVEDAGAVLDRLDTETAADTLNEVQYPLQSELLSELDPERASDLLERLPPDDAADILSEMPPAQAERLLSLMPTAESQPIRDLLRYAGETAGGIMTNEVLALPQNASVEDALTYLRQHSEHLEMVYYLYIVDEERHLIGVVSLRQLVTADPAAHMQDLIDPDVIKVQSDTDQEEVARVISKYDLLGIPVVDADNHLVGLITVDDVIDVIHEEQAEDFSEIAGVDVEETEEEEHFSWGTALRRSSWLAVNVIAGLLLALIVSQVFHSILYTNIAVASLVPVNIGSRVALNAIICLIPMLLLASGSTGSQALGIAGWQLRTKSGRDFWRGFFSELQLGTVGGVLVSVLVALAVWLLFRTWLLSLAIAIGFGITLLIASICGLTLPNLLNRLRLRGSLITAPLLDPVIAIVSLSVFFLITLAFIHRLYP
ncbi:MAG: magnesium transporter [Ktedonobacteraceae bacterium]|nr:magnesium transporter [Ktedonobacteraceae bacterium]